MNKAETALVNPPPRRWLQRVYETQVLLRFGGRVPPGSQAMEIGCGSGYGTQLVLEGFGAASVDAVDLDSAMIRRAGRRLAGYGDRVRLAQGSATDLRAALDAEDGGYDAVFDFGIIHHIPDWRAAIAEVARGLASGRRVLLRGGHGPSPGPPRLPAAVRPPHRGPVHRRAVPRRTGKPRARGPRLAHPRPRRLPARCGRAAVNNTELSAFAWRRCRRDRAGPRPDRVLPPKQGRATARTRHHRWRGSGSAGDVSPPAYWSPPGSIVSVIQPAGW
ncbi:class I SAM-dependent methyltransferase [Amycolatopsis keratiniphila]